MRIVALIHDTGQPDVMLLHDFDVRADGDRLQPQKMFTIVPVVLVPVMVILQIRLVCFIKLDAMRGSPVFHPCDVAGRAFRPCSSDLYTIALYDVFDEGPPLSERHLCLHCLHHAVVNRLEHDVLVEQNLHYHLFCFFILGPHARISADPNARKLGKRRIVLNLLAPHNHLNVVSLIPVEAKVSQG